MTTTVLAAFAQCLVETGHLVFPILWIAELAHERRDALSGLLGINGELRRPEKDASPKKWCAEVFFPRGDAYVDCLLTYRALAAVPGVTWHDDQIVEVDVGESVLGYRAGILMEQDACPETFSHAARPEDQDCIGIKRADVLIGCGRYRRGRGRSAPVAVRGRARI